MFNKVVSALIKDKSLDQFYRIKEEWLLDDELPVYDFLREYIISYEELPDAHVLNDKFKKGEYPVPHGRLGYELNALKDRYIYTELVTKLPAFARILKKNPKSALAEMKSAIQALESDESGTVSPLNKDASKRYDRYTEKVGKKGVTYISFGHPVLDSIFYGLQKTDLFTIAGRAGVGKTWLLIILAMSIEKTLPDEFGPILFISNEMGLDELEDRMDCVRFFLNYKRFLRGELDRASKFRLMNGLKELEKTESKIILIDGCYTLDDYERLLLLYRPAMVALDGSYLMSGDGKDGWEKIQNITRGLKRKSKRHKIPNINTTQMKKGTGTKKAKSSFDAQDDLSFASSYAMDSDIAITGFQTPQMLYQNQIGWSVAKGRRVEPGTTLIWKHDMTTLKDEFFIDTDEDDEMPGLPSNSSSEKDVDIIV